jgi:hypothetical protein
MRDGWGTAQSCYLGQEVTGSRSGNHLADCLLTTRPELYGAIRPAQLLESDVWREEPCETIDCPPFDGFLQPGPLTNDQLQEWLRADGVRPEMLKRLVSILADPAGPNVLILADTTHEAVRWIAAATILLPIRTALDVSFKVFVNNINQASQRIIAVPKELNPSVKGNVSGARFVIDATEGSSGAFQSTPLANFWVERLLEAEDAYDVVEAVDLADVLAGHDAALATEAHETAWAVIAESEKPANPNRLIRWLTAPKDHSLAEYDVSVASRLIESGLADASTLNWMERQADIGRLAVDRSALRRALMGIEIAQAPTAINVRAEELASIDMGDEARRDAESAISSAILLATTSDVVDRLLRTAKRHAIPLKLAPLQDRLHSFVADWIAHPSDCYHPDLWALSESLTQELATQLSSQSEFAGGYTRVRPLIAQVWPFLLPHADDPSSPLTWELSAAYIASAEEKVKLAELPRIVRSLAAGGDGNEALIGFERALVAWRALSGREAMVFAHTILPPQGWPASEFADYLWASVRDAARRPDKLVLDTISRLADWRRLPSSAVTDGLHRADQRVANFLVEAAAVKTEEDLARLWELRRVDPEVVRIRMPEFVDVSLESPVQSLAVAILERLSTSWQRDFLAAWAKALRSNQSAVAAARGFLWSDAGEHGLDGWQREYVAGQIAQHASQLQESERAIWIAAVQSLIGEADCSDFEDFVAHRHRGLRQKLKPSFRGSSDAAANRSKRERSRDDET